MSDRPVMPYSVTAMFLGLPVALPGFSDNVDWCLIGIQYTLIFVALLHLVQNVREGE